MNLVVVTSRCPISHDRSSGKDVVRKNIGGVATALHQAMRSNGGVWICWGDGNADQDFPVEDYEGYRIIRIFLNKSEKHGFYDEYSNGTLWPLFHYFRERIKFTEGAYKQYEAVNRKFADAVSRHSGEESIIWIHDYQLSLVPSFLRQKRASNFIIFTWHIPWVSSEFFNILPESSEIARSLLHCDMITFHTELYRKNFRESCERVANPEISIDDITFAYSLGIDYDYFSKAESAPNILSGITENRKVIFSIDRLDYTKGLINRVLAVERLLKNYPEYRGKFSYVMAVTPSRTTVSEYIRMKRDLETEIGRVNGQYGDIRWQPIIYMYRKVPDRILLSYYRHSHIALITPVMDGLNLVSKEFVAASERGVLILSEFAGAAFNLPQALLVNPNDLNSMAETIKKAMNMPDHEILGRLNAMKASVRRRNNEWWIRTITKRAEDLLNRRNEKSAPEQ